MTLDLVAHCVQSEIHLFGKKDNSLRLLYFRYILDAQRKIYSSGIWTCDLRIDVPALYQLSYLALYWQSPYFVNIFVRGGASQKS